MTTKKNRTALYLGLAFITALGFYLRKEETPTLGPTAYLINNPRPLKEKKPTHPIVTTYHKALPNPIKENTQEDIASDSEISTAAVTDDLNLTLVDVYNPQLWPTGVTFSGSLITIQGRIDSLSVTIANQVISVDNEPMRGNVFPYEVDFERHNALFYQSDEYQYMVTFGDGPFAGTRMVFQKVDNSAIDLESDYAISDDL